MSDSLLVPVTLEILLANNALRSRDFFRTWRHAYAALRDFGSPEPRAFDCDVADHRTGAFLHWTLPRSLRASPEGSTAFPLVPNRWLITRLGEPNTPPKSWVVESDYLQHEAARASYYLVGGDVLKDWNAKAAAAAKISPAGVAAPGSGSPTNAYPVNLGKAFALETWQEHAPLPTMFLTAIAPGNLEFSGYVPFNEGVFSFFDELEGVSSGTTLSYQVTGWYADATQDVVAAVPPAAAAAAAGGRSAAVLAALDWQLDQPPVGFDLQASLYYGRATGLLWDTRPNAFAKPDGLEDTRNQQNLNVALANNSIDALSTLVGTQLEVKGYEDAGHVVELLRAFHYDMLPLLNKPNGSELLSERIRQEWFSSRAGGTQWAIVAAPPAGSPPAGPPAADPAAPPEVALTPAEATWLQGLNAAQQQVDECQAELTSLQWELHAAWWKKNYYAANQPADAAFAQALEQQEQSLQTQVLAALTTLSQRLARVPDATQATGGTRQAQYLQAIADFMGRPESKFADGTSLADHGKTLKALPQSRFWLPSNPTVVVSQVQPSKITDPNSRLAVRLAQAPSGNLPQVAAFRQLIGPRLPAALQDGVAGLYEEFWRLSAPAVASTSPAAWQQQWHPLYLEWEVAYTDVPFVDPATRQPNWRFNGTDYELQPKLRGVAAPQLLSGRSLLSPNAQLTFGARLQKFAEQFQSGEYDLQKLCGEIALVDNWKFLSQELVGLNDWLTQRDTRTFRAPTGENCQTTAGQPVLDQQGQPLPLAKILGFPTASSTPGYDTPAAAQGLVNSVPAIAPTPVGRSAFPFHSVRSGQLYLNHLVLYDKFGRKLELVLPDAAGMLDANVFPLLRDAALLPTFNLLPSVEATVQLPPRLLQPTRLDLLLVNQQDRSQALSQGLDLTPVGGWLLANHLDQALLLFAPDGSSLGEITANRTGAQPPRWVAPPHPVAWLPAADPVAAVAAIAARFPLLGGFIAELQQKTALEFATLLQVIDSTLWTVDPLGSRADQNLSVLVGRPLALVAMQVQLSLYGPPLTGCDWHADDPAASPLTNGAEFSVRLGNQASREDGVIGYFKPHSGSKTSLDYATFHSVVIPGDEKQYGRDQHYVRPIGPLASPAGNYLSLPVGSAGKTDITLLVDPRATIHATTGILPVKTLVLPQRFVHKALANLEISFKVGPLLSRIRPMPASQAAPASAARPAAAPASAENAGKATALAEALSYLPLSEKNGAWSWWEKTSATDPAWKAHALLAATATAELGQGPATLREGYLQFQASLDETVPHPEPTEN